MIAIRRDRDAVRLLMSPFVHQLRRERVHANPGWQGAVSPYRDIQFVQIRREQPRSCAAHRRDASDLTVVVGVLLLKDRDTALATDGVDSMTPLVVEDVVAVSNGRYARYPIAVIGVKDN